MEHIQGSQWWTDYQAVSYKIESKRGSRAQFQNMVSTCHNYGVKVIVDVIFNHMAGIDGGVGVAGTSFSHYNYPGLYTNSVSCVQFRSNQLNDISHHSSCDLSFLGLPPLWYDFPLRPL